MEGFEYIQNLDWGDTNGTAIYKCEACSTLCASKLEPHSLGNMKILGVSTCHITKYDAERLAEYAVHGSKDLATRIMDDEYGTLIHCTDLETLKEIRGEKEPEDALDELSEEFWNIYNAAAHAGFDYILFDRDECEDVNWPKFEW